MELKVIVDIRSLEQEGQLIARAGTVVDFVSDEGDYVVASLKDGSIAFPLDPDEFEIVDDGAPRHEGEVCEDALYMSRGKVKKDAPTSNPTAAEAYKAKEAQTNELLKSIKTGITKQGNGSVNWASVGSLSYAIGLLTDLDNFINGTSK